MLALPVYAQTEPQAPSESRPPAEQSANPSSAPSVAPDASAKPEHAARPEAANQTGSVDAFIARLDAATRAIHENAKKDPALVREGCRALLNEVLDLGAMAKTTNSEIWDQMNEAQRETLRAAFEQRMISNCVRQFGEYDGENMQLAGIKSTSGGDMLATIRFGTRDDAKLVTWRLQQSGSDSLRAIDVITEGRSAMSDARNEFAAVLRSVNGDIEALIAFMQK